MIGRLGLALCTVGVAAGACGSDPVGVDAAVTPPPDAAPLDAMPRDNLRMLLAIPDDLVAIDLPSRTQTSGFLPDAAAPAPRLRTLGRTAYLLDGDGDRVSLIDVPLLTMPPALLLAGGSRPVDAARFVDKLYVVAGEGAGLWVYDLVLGGAPTEISLAALDPDGLPNCVSAYAVGGNVFVACAVLDDGAAGRPARGVAQIAIVDATTDTLADTLALPFAGPVGQLWPTPLDGAFQGDLVIGLAPDPLDPAVGCLARIGVDATPATGCAIDNEDLEGTAGALGLSPDGSLLWMAVRDAAGGKLRALDLDSATVWDGNVSSATQAITDLAVCPNGDVVVRDDAPSAGVRLYSGGTTLELTSAAIPLRPTALACTRR